MAFNVKDPETDRPAREVARLTGESLTEAVRTSLAQRLERVRRQKSGKSLVEDVMEMVDELAKLPILDTRSEDEILGYGPDGNPD